METRHIIGIVAAIGYIAFANRERLKTLAKSAFAKLKPVAGNSKAGWIAAAAISVITFWPDIAAKLPDIRNTDEIRSLQETIVTLDEQNKELAERNQWQAEQIDALLAHEPDIFDRSASSGRALLADAIDELAAKKFDSDQEAEDFMNEKILDCLEAAFGPVGKEIEKARDASRLTDMAAKLKAGELRNE